MRGAALNRRILGPFTSAVGKGLRENLPPGIATARRYVSKAALNAPASKARSDELANAVFKAHREALGGKPPEVLARSAERIAEVLENPELLQHIRPEAARLQDAKHLFHPETSRDAMER